MPESKGCTVQPQGGGTSAEVGDVGSGVDAGVGQPVGGYEIMTAFFLERKYSMRIFKSVIVVIFMFSVVMAGAYASVSPTMSKQQASQVLGAGPVMPVVCPGVCESGGLALSCSGTTPCNFGNVGSLQTECLAESGRKCVISTAKGWINVCVDEFPLFTRCEGQTGTCMQDFRPVGPGFTFIWVYFVFGGTTERMIACGGFTNCWD